MKSRSGLLLIMLLLPAAGSTVDLTTPTLPAVFGETVSTAALVDDGILYAASYETAGRAGHLRAFALEGGRRTLLWDAAQGVPLPGAALPPPVDPGLAALAPPFDDAPPGERRLFTNLAAAQGYRLLTFEARAAHVLQPLLGAASVGEAAALINSVRGRLATSPAAPEGNGDRLDRLGAISASSPALVGGSPFAVAPASRDQVLYAGAEDGLLHAILAGRRNAGGSGYEHAASGCGTELWAYLPGQLLPYLQAQPFTAPAQGAAVHVDGSPAVGEMFLDSDGDGRREWRTILVGTASVQRLNQGLAFALDVTDPYRPRLLWETTLTELAPGRSRGAALGWSGPWSEAPPRIFLTFGTAGRIRADGTVDPDNGRYGALVCALDLSDGRPLWHFATAYAEVAADRADPPSLPALLVADDGSPGGVIFGDLAGRLWVLDPQSGLPRGGGPLWQTPGGAGEAIGAGLAVRNRLVLLGTGRTASTAEERSGAVYAVEILAESARLLWMQPLAPGEVLWGAPAFDRFGRSYFGIGSTQGEESGRLLVVAPDGVPAGSVSLAGAPGGGVAVVPGAVITLSTTGQVEQLGDLRLAPLAGNSDPGRMRVLSWRVR